MTGQNIRYSEHLEVHFDAKLGNSYGNRWEEILPDVYDLLERLHPAWHHQAACRGRTDLFFPSPHEGSEANEAKGICRDCPVQKECAAQVASMGTQGRHGIWAGRSPRQRRQARIEPVHGSSACYRWGCRCAACVDAASERRRARRKVSSPPERPASVSASSPLPCGDDAESLGTYA